jgi:fumarate reductase subunit D
MLGLALEGPNTMDRYLAMTDVLLVKVAEWVLVMLFALHLLFGLRLLALELLPWPHPRDARKPWVTFGGGVAVAVGIIFLIRAF